MNVVDVKLLIPEEIKEMMMNKMFSINPPGGDFNSIKDGDIQQFICGGIYAWIRMWNPRVAEQFRMLNEEGNDES